jgi:nicotinamide mononucleotide (NMN) deamidase PncC
MNETAIDTLVERIHHLPVKLVLEFAGAGSLALYWLHHVAGSSRTVVEASDRYSPQALAELIGRVPEKYVSPETATAMASRAYRRAMRLTGGGTRCLGIGCTATIATDRAKRGDHGCWIAVQDSHEVRLSGLTLIKGQRDRHAEERLVSLMILHALARAGGLSLEVPLGLADGEQLEERVVAAPDPIAMLLEGRQGYVVIASDGSIADPRPQPHALVSGSFNPLHTGHERMAHAVAILLGKPVHFELPVLNADKPPLDYATIERRVQQFAFRFPVVLSRAALFVDKARLFPDCVFVVGYDTAARLVEPRYYGGEAGRDAAFAVVREHGGRFLVAGRLRGDTFSTMRDLPIPASASDLFIELPESLFRVDLSSTAIRQAISSD